MNKNNPLRDGDIVEFTVERTPIENSEVAVEVVRDPLDIQYNRRYVNQPSPTIEYDKPILGNDQLPKPWPGAVTESGK